jgi:hypothetical protein
MSVVQQTQSIQTKDTCLSDSPCLPYMAAGAILLIQGISLVVSPIFAFLAAIVLLTGIAIYLQDRPVTQMIAAGITLLIVGISAAALFPAYTSVAFGCTLAVGSLTFAYALYEVVTKD